MMTCGGVIDDRSVPAFAVKPRAFGAPQRAFSTTRAHIGFRDSCLFTIDKLVQG